MSGEVSMKFLPQSRGWSADGGADLDRLEESGAGGVASQPPVSRCPADVAFPIAARSLEPVWLGQAGAQGMRHPGNGSHAHVRPASSLGRRIPTQSPNDHAPTTSARLGVLLFASVLESFSLLLNRSDPAPLKCRSLSARVPLTRPFSLTKCCSHVRNGYTSAVQF